VATKANEWNRISGLINNAGFHGRAGDSICLVAAGEGAAKLVATCNGTKGEQEASKTTSSDEPQNSTRRKKHATLIVPKTLTRKREGKRGRDARGGERRERGEKKAEDEEEKARRR
jgi:hypothetical protein